MNTPASLRILLLAFSLTLNTIAQDARTNAGPRIYRDRVEPHWFASATGETNKFWYRVDLPQGRREFVLVDAPAGKGDAPFDHARGARALSEQIGKPVGPEHLPIDSLEFDRDGTTVTLRVSGANWKLDLESYS